MEDLVDIENQGEEIEYKQNSAPPTPVQSNLDRKLTDQIQDEEENTIGRTETPKTGPKKKAEQKVSDRIRKRSAK